MKSELCWKQFFVGSITELGIFSDLKVFSVERWLAQLLVAEKKNRIIALCMYLNITQQFSSDDDGKYNLYVPAIYRFKIRQKRLD